MSIVVFPPQSGGSASIADATDTTAGKIRIATSGESTAGTNTVTAMTPALVQAKINAAVSGGVEYKGSFNATTATPSLVTALKGDLYLVSHAGTFAGISLNVNDHIVFNQDAADPVTSSMFDVIDNTSDTSLQKADNLSDLDDAATARTNLGLGTAATSASADFLAVSSNLSDLNDAATARTNLGLGTAATSASTDFLGNVVEDTSPQLGGNLDVNSNDIISVSNGAINLAPDGTGQVTIKGNATGGAGELKLNCENNSHGITIKGPPHSAAASYTLTLPNDDGDADQVLKTDGNGNLDWVDQSGGGGGSKPTVTASTSNTYTITTYTGIEEVFLMSPTGTATITLTAASTVGAGYKYNIKLLTAQTLTVTRAGTDTIDGATTFAISAQYGAVTLMSDGTNWHII